MITAPGTARVTATTTLALAAALTVSACGDDDGHSFTPHPPDSTAAAQTQGGSPAASTSAQHPLPTVDSSGTDASLTEPETVLPFGESTTVATLDDNSHRLVWTLTVDGATPADPARVRLEDPSLATGTGQILCFTYSLTFMGVDPDLSAHPLVHNGIRDAGRTVVTAPTLTPSRADGTDAEEVTGGTDASCGIPADERLPTVESALEKDRTYRGAVLGYVRSGAPSTEVPVGVRFDYDPGVPGGLHRHVGAVIRVLGGGVMARPRPVVLAAGLCALLTTATACEEGNGDGGFNPRPPRSTQASTTETAPAGDAAGTAPGAAEPDPASTLPVLRYPDGREVPLTAPGTKLGFGAPATVATADEEGRLLGWTITVHDGVIRTRDQVHLLDPAEEAIVDHYICYAYEITFLGAVLRFGEDPVVLTAPPDSTAAVQALVMVPVTAEGLNANQVVGSVDDGCGIPPQDRLPVTGNALAAGKTYVRGVLGHSPADTSWPSVPVGVRFDYSAGVPGASTDSASPSSVFWK